MVAVILERAMRSLWLVALVTVLSFSGCKKKAAQQPPPPAGSDTGSGSGNGTGTSSGSGSGTGSGSGSGTGSGQTVADAGAGAPPTGSGSAGSGSAVSGTVEADCALYGEVAAKCGHGLGDAKAIANECLKALVKNTAMAPSIRIQINCAKADATCGPFDTCIAKP